MRIAFFCATPYQILVAINMKYTNLLNKNVDLYILNHFNNSMKIAHNLESSYCFNNIKYIDCINFTNSFSNIKPINFKQKMIAFYNSSKIIKSYGLSLYNGVKRS